MCDDCTDRAYEELAEIAEERDEWKARWQAAVEDAQRLRDENQVLRELAWADIEQIKAEYRDADYIEPDHLQELLGIDPNNAIDWLAAQAVEYRWQRDNLARQIEELGREKSR